MEPFSEHFLKNETRVRGFNMLPDVVDLFEGFIVPEHIVQLLFCENACGLFSIQ